MVDANQFAGRSDSDVLEEAIARRDGDGLVVIPPRRSESEPERDWWLIDRAILIPENTTVVLENCRIKLSDRCRDNFFRSANCGMGIASPAPIRNIHIRGEGLSILEGADHPRATGDGGKILKNPCPFLPEDILRYADYVAEERRRKGELNWDDHHAYSFGTDASRPEESHYGDWRGIGILFANADSFSVENLRIVESHGWGISLEACSNGIVRGIDFDATMYKEIDGMLMNMENQDGVDVRNGCHHIVISDITGQTGDDVIALTAIADPGFRPGGSLRTTHVMPNDWTRREKDIHDIVIRNVLARSYYCFTIRLLPAMTSIYNVVIDGVIESPRRSSHEAQGTILLGDGGHYGENLKNSMRHISISNVVGGSETAGPDAGGTILLEGYLADSVISNVVNRNPARPAIRVSREDGMKNVSVTNVLSPSAD